MNYVYAASGTLILVFVLLILKKERKVAADYWLIGVNLLVGSFLLADVWVNWRLTSASVIFQNGVPLFLFPVFTFYLLQFTQAQQRIDRRWYLLFVPALAFLAWSVIDHYLWDSYATPSELVAHFNQPSLAYQFIFKGTQILFIAVLIWLLRALDRFDTRIKAGYSALETIDLKWLKHFTWIYLGSIAITFVMFLSQNLGWLPLEIKQVFGIVYGVLVVSVFYLNYQGIQHYTLAQVDPRPPAADSLTAAGAGLSDKPALPLTEAERQLEREVIRVIEEEQLYLTPSVSLNDLADRLGTNRHLVSKVINAQAGRSFYDLINGYRVEHLKKLLDDPQNAPFTILALGLDSGFNSKASLNRIFKNLTGLTPRQYLDRKSQPTP